MSFPTAAPRFSGICGLIVSDRLNDVSEFLWAFCPDERRAGLIVMRDELQQILLQFPSRAMHAFLEPSPRQDTEETPGQVDPGSVHRSTMKMHTALPPEPALGGGAFVNVSDYL